MQDGVFSQVQLAAVGAWQRAMAEQVARTSALLGRVAAAEATGALHAQNAIDEWSRLMKETLAYQGELAAEWRKLSLDALQKMSLATVSAPAAGETPKVAAGTKSA